MGVTNWLWRIRSSTLVIFVACAVVTFVLAVWIVRAGDTDMKVIANTVSLGGALLTFFGLSYAYLRADSQIKAWFLRMWSRITGRPLPIPRGYATGEFSVEGTASGVRGFRFTDSRDRTDQLLDFVNSLSQSIGQLHGRIHDVSREVDRAGAEARAGDHQTRAEGEAALRRFADELKQSEVLDLRWAIAGVFFSVFGALFNFFA